MNQFFKLMIIAFGVFFLFGAIGNLRNSDSIESGREYIMMVGDATPKFRDSKIPAEFFWIYLYMTSPLSNVEHTIEKRKSDYSFDNFVRYCVLCLCPEMISKRLGFERTKGELITENLNVGSIYMESYIYYGWIGMGLSFFFMFFFVFVNRFLVPIQSPFYVSSVAIVDIVVLFNIFSNMFVFSGLVPALCYPIFFSLIHRESFKQKGFG